MICPICQSESEEFLCREAVPVNQNSIFRSQSAAVSAPRGDLSLAVCRTCGFIFNQAFKPMSQMYGDGYDNAQTFSPSFSDYVNELVGKLVGSGVVGCRVLEIGCGDGLFLRKIVESGNIGYGFDPSYSGPRSDLNGHIMFEKEYYEIPVEADVVICRHVIEHVQSPLDLLKIVNADRIFIETPDVEWILKNQVIWDFFYEHCSYFSAASLSMALEATGFMVNRVWRVFGDQYLFVEASRIKSDVTCDAGDMPVLARRFAVVEKSITENLDVDGIALWGAGAKGTTLANLVDPQCERIPCLVDLNPRKQNAYVAGTGHPIVDYKRLPKLGVKAAMVMNPNYVRECRSLLSKARMSLDIKVAEIGDAYAVKY